MAVYLGTFFFSSSLPCPNVSSSRPRLWPAVAQCGPAALIGLFCIQKLPVHYQLSTPEERERRTSVNCMCSHTRRQDWITECFVPDRETLCGKLRRERGLEEGGGLLQRRWMFRDSVYNLTAPHTNIIHVQWRLEAEGWGRGEGDKVKGVERRENEWKARQATRITDELCAPAAWGLKDTTAEDRIGDYYWFRTRLRADSSLARRHAALSWIWNWDQMEDAVTSLERGNHLYIQSKTNGTRATGLLILFIYLLR